MGQAIISGENSYKEIQNILKEIGAHKYLLVCDTAFQYLPIKDCFNEFGIPYVKFSEFSPNPLYEDVCKGIKLINEESCDSIIAVGGGSTIDVAKCIKLYCRMDHDENYLWQEYKDSGVPLVAIPTTAGTGSESTRYAVIYFEGKKQSVAHESIIPNCAILEHSVLKTLSLYQKKCTMLDALCQGIESWWSVNSTDESMVYSKKAVEIIMQNMDAYINNNSDEAAESIMLAANYSGRAINITQTTAPHAMSYKLTSMYGLPHGHAVAIYLPKVWRYMVDNLDKCVDPRGSEYLGAVFKDIVQSMGCSSAIEAIDMFERILKDLDIVPPHMNNSSDLAVLGKSVNPIRLKNNPVFLSEEVLLSLYGDIVVLDDELPLTYTKREEF